MEAVDVVAAVVAGKDVDMENRYVVQVVVVVGLLAPVNVELVGADPEDLQGDDVAVVADNSGLHVVW